MNHKIFLCLMILMIISTQSVFTQTEIKGAGNTSATITLKTMNKDNTPSMTILDDGNIGMGTTTPTQKLEVNGMIYSTAGGIKFPDGSVLASAPLPTPYARVYTVAQSGGDFTSIQQAINQCMVGPGGLPSRNNPFLVRVMPGVYNEGPICQPFVDLMGSGKHSCTITGMMIASDSCNIQDFFLQGGVACNGTSPFIIHNLITARMTDNQDGIYINAPGRPWIKENEIRQCNGYGIFCNGFGADAWIIGNKISGNSGGGIRCQNSSPTISNNYITYNQHYGIYVAGAIGTPAEPTIDDNVIAYTTNAASHGQGISVNFYAEPRIIANDIYLNNVGIEIDPPSQPSIIGNNINYNHAAGIACFSPGATKKVVIMSNHIHSNTGQQPPPGILGAGIFVSNCDPLITQNNVAQNRRIVGQYNDIDYSPCVISTPMISLNVYDFINRSTPAAGGLYNVNSAGASIAP